MDSARHAHTRTSQRHADLLSQTRHVKSIRIGIEFTNSIAHPCPNAHTNQHSHSYLQRHSQTHFNGDAISHTPDDPNTVAQWLSPLP